MYFVYGLEKGRDGGTYFSKFDLCYQPFQIFYDRNNFDRDVSVTGFLGVRGSGLGFRFNKIV